MPAHSSVTPSLLLSVGAIAIALSVSAGPLDPAVGPVSSTPGPEPRIAVNAVNTPGDANSTFQIAQPGSYYLEGNVVGEVGKHGIKITATPVTLDLMGFDVAGVPGSLSGIVVETPGSSVLCVRNGSIRDWGNEGLRQSAGEQTLLTDLRVSGNASHGINVNFNGVITDCVSRDNSGVGIRAFGSVIRGCTVESNGISGITVSAGSSVIENVARGNLGHGIELVDDSYALNNICVSNGHSFDGAGIFASVNGNKLEGNCVNNNFVGIDVDGLDNLVIRNSATGNGTPFDIDPGNDVGAIIGGGNILSSNPWANIQH